MCVVTGANSGIGRATALGLAAAGYSVFGTVRSVAKAGKLNEAAEAAGVDVQLVELDVGSDDSVASGLAAILERTGRIDHLVNNAGVAGNGTVEETTTERMLEVLDVDVCGPLRAIRQVLPGMRERGSGTIVNISSVAGRMGAVAQAPYVAAKWALEGLSEQLAHELAPFGVRVAIVEPGLTRSSIFGKNTDAPNTTGAYAGHYARMFQMYAAGHQRATDAAEVAAVVRHAIETDDPKLRYQVSWGGIRAGPRARSDHRRGMGGVGCDRGSRRLRRSLRCHLWARHLDLTMVRRAELRVRRASPPAATGTTRAQALRPPAARGQRVCRRRRNGAGRRASAANRSDSKAASSAAGIGPPCCASVAIEASLSRSA